MGFGIKGVSRKMDGIGLSHLASHYYPAIIDKDG